MLSDGPGHHDHGTFGPEISWVTLPPAHSREKRGLASGLCVASTKWHVSSVQPEASLGLFWGWGLT